MEAFWWHLIEKPDRKTEFELGPLACDVCVGWRWRGGGWGKEHNSYGKLAVTILLYFDLF